MNEAMESEWEQPRSLRTESQVLARRAIEALRSGVPSRAAVAALGSGQGDIEDRFLALLSGVRDGRTAGTPAGGMLLAGGFGTGKSHLLEHLAQLALDDRFVVSRVVISKETPLYDPVKVSRAAIDSAVLPGGAAAALAEAAGDLDPDGAPYAELSRWASDPRSELNERFAATLLLFGRFASSDDELADGIVRFWSGDPIPAAELRRRLRDAGERGWTLSPVSNRELARQRLRFVARLLRTAGFAGWTVLFDEVELIGRYSVLQRARSYAELAGWVGGDTGDPGAPLASVLALTDDFDAAVLTGKNDREQIPAKLRGRGTIDGDELAARAEAGMHAIERDTLLLRPPDAAELDAAYRQLQRLHGEAYGWQPPDVPGLERLSTTRMRQYVRAWINEWDLRRLDPDFTPQTELVPMTAGPGQYQEDADLERNDADLAP